jgi:hypothetical protein
MTDSASLELLGGCFCGSIRYRVIAEPALSLFCFCGDCRATAGTDGYAGLMVPEAGFAQISGTAATHTRGSKAGRSVVRHFCPECGTNLWGVTELGLVSVAAGTLDDPEAFEPTRAVFTSEAPSWARIPE